MARILSITSLPGKYSVAIDRMAGIYRELHADKEMVTKMKALIRAGPVRQKHCFLPDFSASCGEPLLYHSFTALPSTRERMQVYKQLAVGIAKKTSQMALNEAQVHTTEITHLVTFSCTGLYAPGLEFDLSEALGLDPFVKRFAVNFMGCHAAFQALRLAHLIIADSAEAKVLLVGLEICSLHLNPGKSDDNLLANYLFSDGCAACVMGSRDSGRGLETVAFESTSFPNSQDLMGWDIGNLGFEMKLHRKLPSILQQELKAVLTNTVHRFGKSLSEIQEFAIHPGGKNVLTAFENALEIPAEKLQHSRAILARYGNMSSVTIFFVLERMLRRLSTNGPAPKSIYAAAFGPGVSLESALIRQYDTEIDT